MTQTLPSGNLGDVEQVSEFEYDVSIRPDTSNDKHRVWFYFSVRNVAPPQRIILTFVNFSKTKSLYREGMSPVMRSTTRPYWERIPPRSCYYYRSPRHKKAYVLSVLVAFDIADDVYQFAYSFPYT